MSETQQQPNPTYDLVAELYLQHDMSQSQIRSHLAAQGINLTKGQIARAVDKKVPKDRLRGQKFRVRSSNCPIGKALQWLDEKCPKDYKVLSKFVIHPEVRMVAELFGLTPAEVGHSIMRYREERLTSIDRNLQKSHPNFLANTEMQQMVASGDAIDVSLYPKEGKLYILPHMSRDVDYCDLRKRKWIQSLAVRKSDGKIVASLDTELFKRPSEYNCVWVK
jgi:DNA-binding transcriptional ArsR family regulator